ncbi:TPA: hypothetical protein ACX96Z_003512 [Clostridium sporogenes]
MFKICGNGKNLNGDNMKSKVKIDLCIAIAFVMLACVCMPILFKK